MKHSISHVVKFIIRQELDNADLSLACSIIVISHMNEGINDISRVSNDSNDSDKVM